MVKAESPYFSIVKIFGAIAKHGFSGDVCGKAYLVFLSWLLMI